MTKEEIIALAQKSRMFYQPQAGWIAELHHLERFAQLVAAAEREKCAQILEWVDNYANPMTVTDCAVAIRALGNSDENPPL